MVCTPMKIASKNWSAERINRREEMESNRKKSIKSRHMLFFEVASVHSTEINRLIRFSIGSFDRNYWNAWIILRTCQLVFSWKHIKYKGFSSSKKCFRTSFHLLRNWAFTSKQFLNLFIRISFSDKCRLELINSTKMSKQSENDKSTQHQKVFISR